MQVKKNGLPMVVEGLERELNKLDWIVCIKIVYLVFIILGVRLFT